MIIEWTRPARDSLLAIVEYISQDDTVAAHSLVDGIIDSTETTLTSHPNAGRPGRVEGTREWVVHKNYVVAYRVISGQRIQVLTVAHSARLWPKEF